jgi:hypothetical protein
METGLTQAVCKNIQNYREVRRIKPTASDLKFDFTLAGISICQQCMSRSACQIAALLNIPVMDCTYFLQEQVN